MENKFISILILLLLVSMSTIAQNQLIQESSPQLSPTEIKQNNSIQNDSIIEMDMELSADNSEIEPFVKKIPKLLKFEKSDYPPSLVKKGIEGSVILDLLINEKGFVDSVHVVKKLNPILDSLAFIASQKLIFEPAILNTGDTVAVILQFKYDFNIDKVIKKITKFINFKGIIQEKGTGIKIDDAEILIKYSKTAEDSTIDVPFDRYLKEISKFDNQTVSGREITTESLKGGKFSFTSIPSGKIEITVAHPNYKLFKTTLNINRNEETTVKFRLEKQNYNDYEILVIGKREKKEVSKKTLQLEEVKKIPGTGGDALKVVQAMPGVARASFGGGDIVMRGANTNDSRYFVDGVELPWLYHFGLKSIYNSEALKSIDIYQGGFNSRYGGAVAGVVEIKSREASKDRFKGFVDINLLDASFMVETPITDKLSILATARRSYFGEILKKITESDIFTIPLVIAPYYYDYILKADYQINKKHKLYLQLFGAMDKLEIITPSVRGGSENISDDVNAFNSGQKFWQIQGGIKSKFNNTFSNTLNMAYTPSILDVNAFGLFKIGIYGNTINIRDEFTTKLNKNIIINNGIDIAYNPVDVELIIPTADGSYSKDTVESNVGPIGIYTNLEIKPFKNLLLIPGLRVDYYPELKTKGNMIPVFYKDQKLLYKTSISADVSARFTARYDFNDKLTFKGAIGNYNQSPEPVGQSVSKKYGNPYLPTNKASHFVAGAEYKFTDLLNLDIQFYRNYQWNIPQSPSETDRKTSDDPNSLLNYYGDGFGRMMGMEVLFRHDLGKRFFGWVAYTLSRSERWDEDEKKYILFDKDQTHNLQVLGSWVLPKNYQTGFKLRYVTGNPETPVIESIYQEEPMNMGKNTYKSVYGDKYSSRVEPFFQMDVRIDKKIIYDNFVLNLYLDVQNVLYALYKSPEFTTYNYDKTEHVNTTSPIIPALGIKIDF